MSDLPSVVEALSRVMGDVQAVHKGDRNTQQGLRYRHVPFWHRVAVGELTECWPWLGAKQTAGYGALRRDGVYHLAHRYAYEQIAGPIPAGMTIDHLCRNRACCNPLHHEVVSLAENGRRAERTRLTRSGGRHV